MFRVRDIKRFSLLQILVNEYEEIYIRAIFGNVPKINLY